MPVGFGHQQVEIHLAGGDQGDVARAVAPGEVASHLFGRQGGHAGRGPQDAASQGVALEMGRHALFRGAERRLVLVLGDLLEDHLLLHFEVVAAQGRTEDVAQDFDGAALPFGQHGRVVDRLFFAREGVGVRADFVEFAVDVGGGPRGRALEGHVLEEVADSRHVIVFVASAGVDEKTHGRGVGLGVALGDDLQPVVQAVFTKLQGWPPALCRPR